MKKSRRAGIQSSIRKKIRFEEGCLWSIVAENKMFVLITFCMELIG